MTNEFERGGEMVHDTELRDLFAPRRPDAEEFAAGVAERLAAGGGGTGSSHVGWWRRAASWLPGATQTGGSNLLALLFSIPGMLTFGVFALFCHQRDRLETQVERATGVRDPFWKQYLRRHAMAALYAALPIAGSLLGLAFMQLRHARGGTTVIDVATVVVMLAMGLVTFQLGQFARLRGARTRSVAMFVIGLQLTVLFGCVLWVQILGVFDGNSMFGYGATGWALAAGILTCAVTSILLARNWVGGGLSLLVLALVPSTTVFGWPDNSAAAIRERLTAVVERLRTDDLGDWRFAAHMVAVLEEAQEPGVELSDLRTALRSAIDNGLEPHPAVWQAAHRMGLIDRAGWQTLAARPKHDRELRRILSGRGSLTTEPFYMAMLRASDALTAERATELADRTVRAWPHPEATTIGLLDRAVNCIRWLEGIGHGDRIREHTAMLHELLRRHHVREADAEPYAFPGGFSEAPRQGRSTTRATSAALEVIARVGCPEDIALGHVRAYLRHNSGRTLSAPADEPVLKMLARADYYRLTYTIGVPMRGPLEFLIGERMLLAALLLAVLSFRAILLAHRSEAGGPETRQGALP
ncbi:MAG: hypothetical protein NXI31_07125 [bacterium]|nr:hypothetical protein [bacterium]